MLFIHPKLYPIFHQARLLAWVAVADLGLQTTPRTKKQQQSQAVRGLLQWTQDRLGLIGKLDETAFPYFFVDKSQRYQVCFSHSQNKVALILSLHACACDIELRTVNLRTAERFYHLDEVAWLHALTTQNDQQSYIQLLWQLKECFIKLNHGKLTAGLKHNLSPYLAQFCTLTQATTIQTLCLNDMLIIHQPPLLTAVVKPNA